MPMNNRIAFEIPMTEETLVEMLSYIKNAKDHMTEGQTFRLEVSHNVDFVFKGLKPFKATVNNSVETIQDFDSGRAGSYEGLKQ